MCPTVLSSWHHGNATVERFTGEKDCHSRTNALGDLIFGLPAVFGLPQNRRFGSYPNAEISDRVERSINSSSRTDQAGGSSSLCRRRSGFQTNRKHGRYHAAAVCFEAMADEHLDVAVQIHGGGGAIPSCESLPPYDRRPSFTSRSLISDHCFTHEVQGSSRTRYYFGRSVFRRPRPLRTGPPLRTSVFLCCLYSLVRLNLILLH